MIRKKILFMLIFSVVIILYIFLFFKKYKESFTGYSKRYTNIGSGPYLPERDFWDNTNKVNIFDLKTSAKPFIYNPNLQNIPNNQNSYKSWKDEPTAHNNEFYQKIPIKNDLLKLPYYSDFQNNSYRLGFIKYLEIIKTLNDNLRKANIDMNFTKVNINKVQLDNLNNRTWLNRWHEYNPNIKKRFKYIESDIDPINILNKKFQKKINDNQTSVMDNNYLIKYGIIDFDILIYKINNIYKNKDNIIRYDIIIVFFREQDLYIPTFYYEGFIKDGKAYIENIDVIGYYSTDTVLLPTGTENIIKNSSDSQYNFYILNNNLSRANDLNGDLITKNIFNLINIRKNYLNLF